MRIGKKMTGRSARAIERLASDLGWAREGKGAFGDLIPAGARVLIKPNFVLDHNQSNGGMDPMITHQSVIKAVVKAALQTEAAEVVVGDAPIQTCDLAALLSSHRAGRVGGCDDESRFSFQRRERLSANDGAIRERRSRCRREQASRRRFCACLIWRRTVCSSRLQTKKTTSASRVTTRA